MKSQMKKFFWIFIFLPIFGNSQTYNPIFLKDSTVWKYYVLTFFPWNEGTGSNRNLGTSIKNGKLYHNIPNNPYSPYLVREDSISRQIYSFDSYSNAEYLLYDFSLVKGDSFRLYGYDQANCLARKFHNLVVDTTYYIITPLGIRKQIELGGNKMIWREGVGMIIDNLYLTATHFVYNAYCPYYLDGAHVRLICVKQDNQLAYENPYINNDGIKYYYCDTLIYDSCNFQSIVVRQI
jgi:hypothetical protein